MLKPVVHKQEMKYLLNLLLILPTLINSQTKELNFEYFLYGVNHCYFESSNRDFKDNQVDIFFESLGKEEIIAEYLKEKIEKDSIDYVEIKRIDRGANFTSERNDNLSQYYMFSKLLEKGLDKNFPSTQNPKYELEKKQTYSFITGAYLRNGYKINDTIYKISIYVSSKPEHCFQILKNTNSTNVVFDKTYQDTINNKHFNPTSTVYFNPSGELKEYLKIIKDVPEIMERYKTYMSEIFVENISSESNKKKAKKEFIDFKANFEKSIAQRNLEDIEIVKRLLKQRIE